MAKHTRHASTAKARQLPGGLPSSPEATSKPFGVYRRVIGGSEHISRARDLLVQSIGGRALGRDLVIILSHREVNGQDYAHTTGGSPSIFQTGQALDQELDGYRNRESDGLRLGALRLLNVHPFNLTGDNPVIAAEIVDNDTSRHRPNVMRGIARRLAQTFANPHKTAPTSFKIEPAYVALIELRPGTAPSEAELASAQEQLVALGLGEITVGGYERVEDLSQLTGPVAEG